LWHWHWDDNAQADPKRYFGRYAIGPFGKRTQQFESSAWMSAPETFKDNPDLFLQFGGIVFERIAMSAHAERERRFLCG
jgi:hypothetical protein